VDGIEITPLDIAEFIYVATSASETGTIPPTALLKEAGIDAVAVRLGQVSNVLVAFFVVK
jgi:hypothetical protein